MENLHRDILSMFATVEELIHRSVDGLFARSAEIEQEIAIADREVDRRDVQLEEECLKILALHQPVAHDLRRVTAVMKITAELERVADLGVNIAERSTGLAAHPEMPIPAELREMAKLSLSMVHRAIDAFVELSSLQAHQICSDDDQVDRLNDDVIAGLKEKMRDNPNLVEPALHLFSVTRHLERIADLATNIAEDVVYMVDAEIIRHRPPE